MGIFREWWLRGHPWGALLAGVVVGAVLMAPIGVEIRDGGPDCTTCGEYTVTLLGLHVRKMYSALLPVIGGVAGLLGRVGARADVDTDSQPPGFLQLTHGHS